MRRLLDKISADTAEFIEWPVDHVAAEEALRPELAEMRIYDAPLVGVGAADDPLFAERRRASRGRWR